MKKGTIIAICLVAVGGAIALYFGIYMTSQFNERFENAFSSSKPTFEELQSRCYDILKDQLGTEPPQYTVNLCAGTAMDELNK